jgi:hypothetical protein
MLRSPTSTLATIGSITSIALLAFASACSSDDGRNSSPDGGSGASSGDGSTSIDRGKVLSAEPLATFTRAQLEEIRAQAGELDLPAPEFDVTCTKLRYETIDLRGEQTTASGLECAPVGAPGPRPLLSYQHGTVSSDSEIPSAREGIDGLSLSLFYATAGYVTSSADYLGFGAAPGLHPYLHASTEATASVDMIRAVRRHAGETGITFGPQLFLAGYSQGGHATMALHRALEADYATELPVSASVAMAGPYDMSKTTLEAAFATPSPATPTYLAYLLVAYDMIYDVYPSPEAAFVDAEAVLPLFDRKHTFEDIMKALPKTPEAVLRPEFLDALRSNTDHPFRVALRANDVYDWKPRAPVRLCHGGADRDVAFQNAVVARERMKALGGDVELVEVGAQLDHGTAGIPCEVASRRFFDDLVAGDTP